MITTKEAINLLIDSKCRLVGEENYMTEGELIIKLEALQRYEEDDRKIIRLTDIDMESIIVGLGRQIAKKVLRTDEDGQPLPSDLIRCPGCGRLLNIMYAMNHCKECGQKLDWSGTK